MERNITSAFCHKHYVDYFCNVRKKVAFKTFGCKLNYAETSQIARRFADEGYEIVDNTSKADFYIINSCTVTSISEKKCRTAIRTAKMKNPDLEIAVIGCFSELKSNELNKMEEVSYVLGNADKHKILEFIQSNEGQLTKSSCHNKFFSPIVKNDIFIPSYSSGDRTRSFLKIQDGCDYFCSYCTIPLARGRSRSDTVENTVSLANEIAQKGIKEIVLTGVNIGDFGKRNNQSFYQLITTLENNVEGVERYRISSIEPDLLSDEIITFVARSKKFLPHFHIPLQSGNNKVLELMKRHYKRELFAERILKIKELMPYACIAADVIVGFPYESDEYFEDTYKFIENLPLSYLHVFTYSERPNTKSIQLENKIPINIRRQRSNELQKLSDRKKNDFYSQNLGSKRKVLFESDIQNGYIFGFTENYIRVKTSKNLNLINQIVEVALDELLEEGIFKIIV